VINFCMAVAGLTILIVVGIAAFRAGRPQEHRGICDSDAILYRGAVCHRPLDSCNRAH
jgi:hypothetical protein